jgi:hypothetical protein
MKHVIVHGGEAGRGEEVEKGREGKGKEEGKGSRRIARIFYLTFGNYGGVSISTIYKYSSTITSIIVQYNNIFLLSLQSTDDICSAQSTKVAPNERIINTASRHAA